MKDTETRDTLVLAGALSALTVLFLLIVVLPGRRAAAQARREIAEVERSLREIPLRMAELRSLDDGLRRRSDYLDRNERLIPRGTQLHAVIAQVARLAETHGLTVRELKPLAPVSHASYQALPFRMAFCGSFRGTAGFLRGLEGRDRLFTFDDLTLTGKGTGTGTTTDGDLHFTVYVRHADSTDSTDSNASSAARPVDNR